MQYLESLGSSVDGFDLNYGYLDLDPQHGTLYVGTRRFRPWYVTVDGSVLVYKHKNAVAGGNELRIVVFTIDTAARTYTADLVLVETTDDWMFDWQIRHRKGRIERLLAFIAGAKAGAPPTA